MEYLQEAVYYWKYNKLVFQWSEPFISKMRVKWRFPHLNSVRPLYPMAAYKN